MDHKAKIPIGEPGCPESSTQHMKKALRTANITLEASDHNFDVASVTPSVNLICTIPNESLESFYGGQVYVGLKNSIIQPSDPLRHVVELIDVLHDEFATIPPYLVLFTDGGGDHNITFLFNQCVLLALFKILDVDISDVGRCAPCQLYINPAERVMSLINIGSQGLFLDCSNAGPFETVLSSCSTMKSVREKSEQHQVL